MSDSAVREKSFGFAVRVVRLARYLEEQKHERVISRQLLRSGTAIGALVREAEQGESKADFIHKMAIALKEAHESAYWIELLAETETIDAKGSASLLGDLDEVIRLLTAIIKTAKKSN